MILAIVQTLPKHPQRLVRVDSFASFQSLCGMIEDTSYLAAHAACHGKMNGISRILAADADIADLSSVRHALDLVFNGGPFDALVIPGLTDAAQQLEICAMCQPHCLDFDFRLFLDPPQRTETAKITKLQAMLPRFASYCWPYVSTVTPGRRSAEWIPPSCLIAPLALGTATHLRGVHDLPSMSPDDIALLNENHVEIMVNRRQGPRTVVAALVPPSHAAPQPTNAFTEVQGIPVHDDEPQTSVDAQIEAKESAIEAQILAEVEMHARDLYKQYVKNDAMLWSALTRSATAVLMQARSTGLIKSYKVRCDAETASWGTPDTPVVEILLEFPKRVKQARFSVERQ